MNWADPVNNFIHVMNEFESRQWEKKTTESRIKRTSFKLPPKVNGKVSSVCVDRNPKLMRIRAFSYKNTHHYDVPRRLDDESHRVAFKRVCGAHYILWNKFKSYPKHSAEQ